MINLTGRTDSLPVIGIPLDAFASNPANRAAQAAGQSRISSLLRVVLASLKHVKTGQGKALRISTQWPTFVARGETI